jgi:DNA-binding CsgD family transcriptional regulator
MTRPGEVLGTGVLDYPPTKSPAVEELSPREREVLALAVLGDSNAVIATRLSLSRRTVENHLARVYRKLNVRNRAQLTRVAIDHGLDRYLPAVGTSDSPVRRPAEPPERGLNPAELRELVHRLVAVPGMRDRAARELYGDAMEQVVGDRLFWRRQVDDMRDVWAMAHAALDRPGALRALVQVLTAFYPAEAEVAALGEYVERISREQESAHDSTAYLLIQVEPRLDPNGREDAYTLSPFRQWYGPESWHSRRGESRSVHRADLEREVDGQIEQMEVEWSDRIGTVIVEFVLPWELLNADVAWWNKESRSFRPTPLAMDYAVVVRSLERLRTPRWHRSWWQRWLQLQGNPTENRIHWSQPTERDYHTRLETELKSDGQIVALVLSEPPTSQTGRLELEAGLRAGLPIVIWHQEDCTDPAFREAVTQLVSDGGLSRLPMRVRELRMEALRLDPDARVDHVGRRLVVLWDDPERKPWDTQN